MYRDPNYQFNGQVSPNFVPKNLERTLRASRLQPTSTRADRQQRKPYDVQLHKVPLPTRQVVSLLSQEEEGERDGSILQRVTGVFKDKVVGWAKDVWYGSQRTQQEEEKWERPSQGLSQMSVDQYNQKNFIEPDQSLEIKPPQVNLEEMEFSFVTEIGKKLEETNKNEGSTAFSNFHPQIPHSNNPGAMNDLEESEGNFTTFTYALQEAEKKRRQKESYWSKYCEDVLKNAPIANRQLKPSFLDSIKFMVQKTNNSVVTLNNRWTTYGKLKLRKEMELCRPTPGYPENYRQLQMEFKRRKRVQAPQRVAMPKVFKQEEGSSQMSISSQRMTQQSQGRKMREEVVKSMTKEELERFKKDAVQSKRLADVNQDARALESFISMKAKELQPRVIANQIRQTKKKIEQGMKRNQSKQEKDSLMRTMKELMRIQSSILEEKEKQKEETRVEQEAFYQQLTSALRDLTHKSLEVQDRFQSIADSQYSQNMLSQQDNTQQLISELSQNFSQQIKGLQDQMAMLASNIGNSAGRAQKEGGAKEKHVEMKQEAKEERVELKFEVKQESEEKKEPIKVERNNIPDQCLSFGEKSDGASRHDSFKSENLSETSKTSPNKQEAIQPKAQEPPKNPFMSNPTQDQPKVTFQPKPVEDQKINFTPVQPIVKPKEEPKIETPVFKMETKPVSLPQVKEEPKPPENAFLKNLTTQSTNQNPFLSSVSSASLQSNAFLKAAPSQPNPFTGGVQTQQSNPFKGGQQTQANPFNAPQTNQPTFPANPFQKQPTQNNPFPANTNQVQPNQIPFQTQNTQQNNPFKNNPFQNKPQNSFPPQQNPLQSNSGAQQQPQQQFGSNPFQNMSNPFNKQSNPVQNSNPFQNNFQQSNPFQQNQAFQNNPFPGNSLNQAPQAQNNFQQIQGQTPQNAFQGNPFGNKPQNSNPFGTQNQPQTGFPQNNFNAGPPPSNPFNQNMGGQQRSQFPAPFNQGQPQNNPFNAQANRGGNPFQPGQTQSQMPSSNQGFGFTMGGNKQKQQAQDDDDGLFNDRKILKAKRF